MKAVNYLKYFTVNAPYEFNFKYLQGGTTKPKRLKFRVVCVIKSV